MKTEFYNPSKLELDFARALVAAKDQLNTSLQGVEIVQMSPVTSSDNPYLLVKVQDEDGDLHELVIQLIQRPDSLVK